MRSWKNMKQQLLTVFTLLLFTSMALGQTTATSTETESSDKDVKDKVLEDIQGNFESKTSALDATIARLDQRVSQLDRAISASVDARDKADKLLERVQALESKQSAVEQNELNVYQANYQSAIINLVSMDREIKPLMLFQSTRNFYSSLSEVSNPMNYPGYQQWYKEFSGYVQNNKNSEAKLMVLNNLLNLTGSVAKGLPLAGPITEPLFSGMAMFINSLNTRKDAQLREQSERMFSLTAKLAQFTHDKNLVEHEWDALTKELAELQKHYNEVLTQNLKILNVDPKEFEARFTREQDANRRYQYLTLLRQRAADVVALQKNNNPKEWKNATYYQMQDIQALKLRFGQLTFNISENINDYKSLFEKYSEDNQIGGKVKALEAQLAELKRVFDSAFEPIDYINSATRMYIAA